MRTLPRIIGVGGNKFGAGKDTVALRLSDYGYRRFAFGDPLKREANWILTDSLYREQTWDSMPEPVRDAALVCLALGQLDTCVKPTTPEVRLFLQLYGTEFRRVCSSPTYWLDLLDQEIRESRAALAVVPDMRFENEWAWVRERGESWYVTRPEEAYAYSDLKRHASEGALENLEHDWRIQNDGSIPELWSKIDDRVTSLESPAVTFAEGGAIGIPQGPSLHI